MQTDGVQPISRIEIDIADLRGNSTRSMGFGCMESLEGYSGPWKRIKNE